MAGGISLGGAYFTLEASSAGLIQALKQAEDASKKSVQAISQQTGIAERDVQQLAQTWIAAEKRRADASAAAALKIIKADNDASASAQKASQVQAQSSKGANAEMLNLIKGFGGFAAAAAGISVGAETIHAALTKVTEETQRAAQAQFALNQLYGTTAPLITQQAEDLAKLAGQSRTSAKEAAASVATLARNYALTGAQIQQVLKISADLAAVRGVTMEAASERVASALRGEAEAIEYLGQALQSGALKAFGEMTAEQRAQFETLSDITKAQIILNTLTKNAADLQGAAAKRTQDAAGATQNLQTAIDNLAASIGKKFSPEVVATTNALAGFVVKADEIVNSKLAASFMETRAASHVLEIDILRLLVSFDKLAAAQELWRNMQIGLARSANAANDNSGIQIGPDPGMPGAGPGPTQAQAQAFKDADALRRQQAAADKDAVQAYVTRQTKAIGEVADAREKAARDEAKRADDAIDKEKIRLEVAKDAALKNLEERHDAVIKRLEQEGAAEEAGYKATIDRLELEKQAQIDAADAANKEGGARPGAGDRGPRP